MVVPSRRRCFMVLDFHHLRLEPLDNPIAELGNKSGIILEEVVIAMDFRDIGVIAGYEANDGVHELVRAALVAQQEVLEDAVRVDGLHQLLLAKIVQQPDAILVRGAEQFVGELVHHLILHVPRVEEVDEGLQGCMLNVHLHHLRVHHILHGCEHVLECH